MPERLTAGLVTGCSPSVNWRATRRGTVLLIPAGLRTSTSPVEAFSGTRNASRVGRLISTCADSPSTSTAGGPNLCGPRFAPVTSISPSGRRCCRRNVADARRGRHLRNGLGRAACHSLVPDADKRTNTQSIQAGGHIVENDAPALGERFQLSRRKRFGDVEQPEKKQRDQRMRPSRAGSPAARSTARSPRRSRQIRGRAARSRAPQWWLPERRAARASTIAASPAADSGPAAERCSPHAAAAHNSTAAMEPQVPGPGLMEPAPKNVAVRNAQRVLRV